MDAKHQWLLKGEKQTRRIHLQVTLKLLSKTNDTIMFSIKLA